ncbi:hypothetical protein HPB51_019992 [Rhipicephalus microplus]|uniref:Uncharacterized protein n=1 Tax=Rhipicephalus microplus TaxID=6941 RepID=A0A9J6DBN3_RHIMP|nr:hypothetical protein HPB51_019992 [Rhipicephalus microplus]
MAGSSRAVTAADAGRGFSCTSLPKDYRLILPPLPTGEGLRRTLVLHCDIAARPYGINDFRKPLKELGIIQEVSGIGAYQMSHVWLLNMKTDEAKKIVLDAGLLSVKDRPSSSSTQKGKRVPRCAGCRAFGHEQADCTRSYASAASRATNADHSELLMDEEEAERAAASKAGEEASHAVATSEEKTETPKQDTGTDENTVVGTPTQRRSTQMETQHKAEPVIGSDATSNLNTVEATPVKRRLNEETRRPSSV